MIILIGMVGCCYRTNLMEFQTSYQMKEANFSETPLRLGMLKRQ